jgi:hypothetical protein
VTDKLQNRLRRLRALVGAAAIFLGAIAAPVTLASQIDTNTCAMACCVAEGHCCCIPSKSSVKRGANDKGASFAQKVVSKSCPDGCAPSQTQLKIQSRLFARHKSHQAGLIEYIEFPASTAIVKINAVIIDSAPPRAPPFFLT